MVSPPSSPIETVIDRLAISDVLTSYATGVDRRDWPLVESCFAPDAFVAGSRMQAPFREYFEVLKAEIVKFDRTVHFVGNHRAVVGEDRADAATYAVALHFTATRDGGLQRMAMGVVYHDKLRRHESAWCISARTVEVQWVLDDDSHGASWSLPAVMAGGRP